MKFDTGSRIPHAALLWVFSILLVTICTPWSRAGNLSCMLTQNTNVIARQSFLISQVLQSLFLLIGHCVALLVLWTEFERQGSSFGVWMILAGRSWLPIFIDRCNDITLHQSNWLRHFLGWWQCSGMLKAQLSQCALAVLLPRTDQ